MDNLVALGNSLRQARENEDLSLEELEKKTRIRLKFLEAMEAGAFQEIDNPIQLRGFLRNYASAVNLDPDVVVAHYDIAIQASGSKRRGFFGRKAEDDAPQFLDLSQAPENYQKPSPTSSTIRNTQEIITAYTSADQQSQSSGNLRGILRILLIVLVAAGLTGAIVGGIIFGLDSISEDPTEEAPDPIVTFSTPIGGQEDDSVTTQPTPTVIGVPTESDPVIFSGDGLFVELIATERLWVEIIVDGVEQFSGVMIPNNQGLQYAANDSVYIKTTNAGGLDVTVNERPVSLGEGRVEGEATFTEEDGAIVPTQPPPTSSDISSATTASAEDGANANDTAANQSEASPTATLFFTPMTSPSATQSVPSPTLDPSAPTPLPSPIQFTSTATLIPSETPIPSSPTPTATLTPTEGDSPTPTLTISPSPTPTIPATATPFLPPRETRTPLPEK